MFIVFVRLTSKSELQLWQVDYLGTLEDAFFMEPSAKVVTAALCDREELFTLP